MFLIRITVIHPQLGTFVGDLPNDRPDETGDDAKDTIQVMQDRVGNMPRLVLIRSDGTEMAFPKPVLDNSVLFFKIVEVE